MRPALVVGLGGTGAKAVAYLKQRLLTEQRWRDLDGAADTAAAECPVLLRAVDLDRQNAPDLLEANVEQIFLNAPIGQVIERIRERPDAAAEAYPMIMSWFTLADARNVKPDEVKEFMSSGAGQVRAFGRLAFFSDLANDRIVPSRFRKAFDELTKENAGGELPLFIVSSVAGGTGAGLLIDMLAWLQKERTRGGVAFRTTVFLALSAAFNRTLHGRLLNAAEANGYAVLRELDRVLECRLPIDFQWGIQERHEMRTPPTQHVYLIDGQRGEGANQHLNRYDAGLVCPAAVADAIYAHLLPAAGNDLTSYLANVQEHAVGRPDLYSTFGVYVVEYIWDQLIRGFSTRAAADLVGRLLAPVPQERVRKERERLLAGVSVVDGVELPALAVLTDLASAAAKASAARPRREWLYPPADQHRLVTEPNLAGLFPDLKSATSPYEGKALVRRVEERISSFWGAPDGEWGPGAEKQFHPTANRNRELIERYWNQTVRVAAADVMSTDGGGPPAGAAFLGEVRGELEQYRQRLESSPPPNVDAARQRLAQTRERAQAAKSMFTRASAQRSYLEQAQHLLKLEVQAEIQRRGQRIVEHLIGIVEEAIREVTALQLVVEETGRALGAVASQVVEERKRAEELPLRRLVPRLNEPRLENALYDEYAGPPAPDGLPANVTRAREQVRWRVVQRPDGSPRLSLLVIHGVRGENGELTADWLLESLQSLMTPLFAPLRFRSVFEILARSGQDGVALAQELVDGGTWLARYDKGEHDRFVASGKADSQLQEKRYTFALWPADDQPGGKLGRAAQEYLRQQGVEIHDIEQGEQDIPRPISDKIVCLAARHRLLLRAFTGFSNLRESYELRRAAPLSPHVLREEKGAARIEATAESLVDTGVRKKPLAELTGRPLAYCADLDLLCAVAIGLANDTLRVKRDDLDRVLGWWVSTDEGDSELDDSPAKLGDILLRLATPRTGVDRRQRTLVMRAADEAKRYPDCEERTQRWFSGSPVSHVDKDLWEVLAVAAYLNPQQQPD